MANNISFIFVILNYITNLISRTMFDTGGVITNQLN